MNGSSVPGVRMPRRRSGTRGQWSSSLISSFSSISSESARSITSCAAVEGPASEGKGREGPKRTCASEGPRVVRAFLFLLGVLVGVAVLLPVLSSAAAEESVARRVARLAEDEVGSCWLKAEAVARRLRVRVPPACEGVEDASGASCVAEGEVS